MKNSRWGCVKAFTLVEILIVIIIVGIIAGFGIPNYSMSIGRAKARDAMNNLSIIHAANVIYRIRTAYNTTSSNVFAINQDLLLNIIPTGSTGYSCDGTTCIATSYPTGDFTVTVYLDSPLGPTNPSCTTGAKCPK